MRIGWPDWKVWGACLADGFTLDYRQIIESAVAQGLHFGMLSGVMRIAGHSLVPIKYLVYIKRG